MSQLEQILIEVEQNVKWKLPSSFTLTEGLLMKYFVSSLSGEEVTKLWNKFRVYAYSYSGHANGNYCMPYLYFVCLNHYYLRFQ